MPASPHRKRTQKKPRFIGKSQKKEAPCASTPNGQLIANFMFEHKIKGFYKDFVLFHGTKLIDWLGQHELATEHSGELKSIRINGIALVHKSKLHKIIGEDVAWKFWQHGMRTNIGVESRDINVIKKA